MYDIIGDIHGYATELKALLTKMDYQEIDGVWQHPERKVIFLGDFVDRGPEQVETVHIAKAMVVKSNALAVMGNHEYNAVAWATPDPKNSGKYLRPHIPKNLKQHKEFLEQIGDDIEMYQSIIKWFKTLPIYLDLPELRVVHACWHPDHIQQIKPYLDGENCLLAEAWESTARENTKPFRSLETLLKGLEISLPEGCSFPDKDGNSRTKIRTRWWAHECTTYREFAMVPDDVIELIPDKTIENNILPGYDGEKPVFIGHYWRTGEPAPLTDHIACLDYSIAGDHGGKLCAYRWDGSATLKQENFVYVTS